VIGRSSTMGDGGSVNSIENRRLRLWNRLLSTTALVALAAVAAILGSTGQRFEGFPALHDPIILIGIVLLAGPVLALAGFMSSSGRINRRLDHLRRIGLPGTALFKTVTMPTRMTGGGPVMEVFEEIYLAIDALK